MCVATPFEAMPCRPIEVASRTRPKTGGASCTPCGGQDDAKNGRRLVNYAQYCKLVCKDKEERKEAVKSFKLVKQAEARAEMDKVLQMTVKKMQLPQDIRNTRDAEDLCSCLALSVRVQVARLQWSSSHTYTPKLV